MSGAAAQQAQATPRQVSVNGYIDAITGNRIYGWAWDAQQPKAKIAVRLVVGHKTVGSVNADQPREDLKANGIGDGAHAFEAAIPEGVSPNEIAILAICPDTGVAVELTPRAVAGGPATDQDLRVAVETLTRSHGFIHRKLQAIAQVVTEKRKETAERAGAPAAGAEPAPLPRLQTLEEAVLRLDDLVQAQGAAIDALRHQGRDRLPRLLAGAAAVLSLATLIVALLR